MFKFFNFYKKKTSKNTDASNTFGRTNLNEQQITAAITDSLSIFMENPSFDDELLIDAIAQVTRERQLAVALSFFIPEALCRQIVPKDAKHADKFIVYESEHNSTTYKYADEPVYARVVEILHSQPESYTNNAMNILQHSATFDALNKALKNGSVLKNLDIGPCVVFDIKRSNPH